MTTYPENDSTDQLLREYAARSASLESEMGPEAPELFEVDGSRSFILSGQGRMAEAVAICESRLAKQGARSLATLPCVDFQDELGRVLGLAGRTDEAVSVLEAAHERLVTLLGTDNPRTIEGLENVASALGRAGRHADAAPVFGQVAQRYARSLGTETPEALAALRHQALAYSQAGVPGAAAEIYQQLVDVSSKQSGHRSEQTLELRERLVAALAQRGHSSALAQSQQLVDDSAQTLGAEHPATLTRRMMEAELIGESGDTQRAAAAYRQIRNFAMAALGENHDIVRRCSRGEYWAQRVDPRWRASRR